MCVKSMAQKLKQTQSKLTNAKHELDDVLRESENAKGEIAIPFIGHNNKIAQIWSMFWTEFI